MGNIDINKAPYYFLFELQFGIVESDPAIAETLLFRHLMHSQGLKVSSIVAISKNDVFNLRLVIQALSYKL